MKWNWQHEDWPNFVFEKSQFQKVHEQYLHKSGVLKGYLEPLLKTSRSEAIADILTEEAYITSEIEGEYLHRQSIRASIENHFGLSPASKSLPQKEANIAKAITDVHLSLGKIITVPLLNSWHKGLLNKSLKIKNIGVFRSAPVYIISGGSKNQTVHYEAPEHNKLDLEMKRFIEWFNNPVQPPIVHASIAHLYFESIHPYADGNGRIGRLLVEKSLMEDLDFAPLLYLSWAISRRQKEYYALLSQCSKGLEITTWLEYFSEVVLQSMDGTIAKIRSILEKAKVYDSFAGELNPRQRKAIDRVFAAAPDRFDGGLSANNYLAMTKCSRATATRDLSALVQLKIFRKEGSLKTVRYFLQKEIESVITLTHS